MSRKDDLEESIRESYQIICDYEAEIRLGGIPEAKARARRQMAEQRKLLPGYIAEYKQVCAQMGYAMPADIAEVAASIERADKRKPEASPAATLEVDPTMQPHPHFDPVIVTALEEERDAILSAGPNELPIPVPETVLVPAGKFLMGRDPNDRLALQNEPIFHPIDLPAFRVGKYPVTNVEYEAFCRATHHIFPEHWTNGQIPTDKERHPVVFVNYEDARAYCEWLAQITGETCRLPTEEEWEKAARGRQPETRRYPWGDAWNPTNANTRDTGCGDTTPVDAYAGTNVSPFGAVDMVGNVWEWTSTLYKKDRMVIRGGSWDYHQKYARVSCRGRDIATTREANIGFRVVQSVGG